MTMLRLVQSLFFSPLNTKFSHDHKRISELALKPSFIIFQYFIFLTPEILKVTKKIENIFADRIETLSSTEAEKSKEKREALKAKMAEQTSQYKEELTVLLKLVDDVVMGGTLNAKWE